MIAEGFSKTTVHSNRNGSLTCREEDPRQRALPEPQQLDHVVEVSWKSAQTQKSSPIHQHQPRPPKPQLTHSEEQRAGEDGGGRPSTGHQHGQHAGPEHQLLRQRRHHLVPQPAHVADAQRPEAGICRDSGDLKKGDTRRNPRSTDGGRNSPRATLTPSVKVQGQSMASCMRGPRKRTYNIQPEPGLDPVLIGSTAEGLRQKPRP